MSNNYVTPDYSCWYKYKETVYEPAEDSFIFLDGIEKEIKNFEKFKIGIELGSGSGIVSTSVAQWTGSSTGSATGSSTGSNFIISTDINPNAAKCTKEMLNNNKCSKSSSVVMSDAGDGFRDSTFDFVLINPPYVITSRDELIKSQKENGLEAAWAGGHDGTELLYSKLLPAAFRLLRNDTSGFIYLIAIKENKLKSIIDFVKKYKYSVSIVIQRKAGREYLYLLKIYKIEHSIEHLN